jgi:hypothetical protein
MAEEPVSPVTPTKQPVFALTNHTPVTSAVFAGAVSSFILATMKARFGLDLAGQEGNLLIIIMGLVGYLTGSA